MKTKYRKRLIPITLLFMVLIMTSQVFASDTTIGQQTISNKGTYYKVKDNGNGTVDVYVDGVGWSKNHDANKPIDIKISHNIPLPKGTTKSKLSFKDDDIKNFGKEGDQFDNGHTNVKNGQDLIDKAGKSSAPPTKYTDHGVVVDKNGNVTHGYDAIITLTPNQMKVSSLPQEVLNRTDNMTTKNSTYRQRLDILVEAYKNNHNNTHNNIPMDTLSELAKDPRMLDNAKVGMLETLAILEVTETEDSRIKEPTPNPGPGSCPTEFEALRSRREYLYTDYTTTDLPTPPTRNHGGCPSQDNEGFWNYTDEPAWGQNFFPVADEGGNKKMPLPYAISLIFLSELLMGNDI